MKNSITVFSAITFLFPASLICICLFYVATYFLPLQDYSSVFTLNELILLSNRLDADDVPSMHTIFQQLRIHSYHPTPPPHTLTPLSSSLYALLHSIKFYHSGTVYSTDHYYYRPATVFYAEPENISTAEWSWITPGLGTINAFSVLYQSNSTQTPVADRITPPIGMRSAVPIGGVGSGSFEMRADGSVHEWTIMNQSPAGSAKFGVVDKAVIGIRVDDNMNQATAKLMRTHPPDQLPGVDALRYQGAYPVSRWDVLDESFAANISVFGYSTFQPGDLNRSATPAAIFTGTFQNPTAHSLTVSLLLTIPMSIDYDQHRMSSQTFQPQIPPKSREECLEQCSRQEECLSWTYIEAEQKCMLNKDIPYNAWNMAHSSGVAAQWEEGTTETATAHSALLSTPLVVGRGRGANGPATGSIGLLPTFISSNDKPLEYTLSAGGHRSLRAVWKEFSSTGQVRTKPDSSVLVQGAAAVTVVLPPGESASLTVVMGWYLPHRNHLKLIVGNHYASLFSNVEEVLRSIVGDQGGHLKNVVREILSIHTIYHDTSLPAYLTDFLLNSISHIRSAMYVKGGVWRQWEAFDCIDIDSIHNDYQRHIPYLLYYPDTEKHKLLAWGSAQSNNGMLPEVMAVGCINTLLPWDTPGGRDMADTTSLYVAEVWEVYVLTGDIALLTRLYPIIKKAVEYQQSKSPLPGGLPLNYISTYDLLKFERFEYSMFNSVLYLLSLVAGERIGRVMKDEEFTDKVRESIEVAKEGIERELWYEEGGYYRSVASQGMTDNDKMIMSDSLYGQMIAYTLGLGELLPPQHIVSHLKAEVKHNDSPYGLLVQPTLPRAEADAGGGNTIWMQGSQDWTALALWANFTIDVAITQGEKGMNNFRTRLNDIWNIWGLLAGINMQAPGNVEDGAYWVTSHYSFHMTLWHTLFAYSRQYYFAPDYTLTFDPIVNIPYRLPVGIPAVLGQLSAAQNIEGEIIYTLYITSGEITLKVLRVSGVNCRGKGMWNLKAGDSLVWSRNQEGGIE